MNSHPIIHDYQPPKSLPFMASVDDAIKLTETEQDNFYFSAFMFQCWLAELFNEAIAQFAEKPDPAARSFQSGQAWHRFQKHCGKATDSEFPHVFGSLMRFAQYDDFFCRNVFDASVPLSIEHELTGDYLGTHT